MAKLFGLNGYASGKLGNTVLAVSNGIQIARQYQPIVNNPKSTLQNMQRAKGNFAGRVSSFVPRTAISGLGQNARRRRAEFLRILLKGAVATKSGDVYTAKIADEDILFSRGAELLSVVNPNFAASANNVVVELYGLDGTIIPADEYASKATRLVAMIYDNTTQNLVEVVTKIATKPNQGSTATTPMATIHPGGYTAVIYAIPMSTNDGSAMSIDTSLVGKTDDEIAASLSVNNYAVVFNYGRSVCIGTTTYTPAP